MFNIKHTILLFLLSFCALNFVNAQGKAEIATDEPTFDYGTIAESNGLASHVFIVKNTGDAPLVITKITASCGCTQPEFSKSPIDPGKTGEVKITYNPKGRPGPFQKNISVFSNARNGRLSLYIKGNVSTKPQGAAISYPYGIGDLKLETKTVSFNNLRNDEALAERISVKNEGQTTLTVRFGKIVDYIIAGIKPTTLKPNETAEVMVLFNAKEVKRKGRVTAVLPLFVEGTDKKHPIEGQINVAANIIDDFARLSASEKEQGPAMQFSTTLLEFGNVTNKGGGLPLVGGKISKNITVTNTGKSSLLIYSFTSDNELLDVSGGKKELKPGASTIFKVTIRSKEIKAKLESFVNVVCNDPSGPVRLIKVTAEK